MAENGCNKLLLGRENIIVAKLQIIILIAAKYTKIYKKVSFYAVF